MSSVRLCSKCGVNPKYKSHASYCYECIRSYNANRYRKGTALKDFFPEMRKRVLELSSLVADTSNDELIGKVLSLSDFLTTIETQLPGSIKEREERWTTKKAERVAKDQASIEEENALYEVMMNHWYSLIKARRNAEAGKYALETIEPVFPDAFDRGWAPKDIEV